MPSGYRATGGSRKRRPVKRKDERPDSRASSLPFAEASKAKRQSSISAFKKRRTKKALAEQRAFRNRHGDSLKGRTARKPKKSAQRAGPVRVSTKPSGKKTGVVGYSGTVAETGKGAFSRKRKTTPTTGIVGVKRKPMTAPIKKANSGITGSKSTPKKMVVTKSKTGFGSGKTKTKTAGIILPEKKKKWYSRFLKKR